jgi:tetratricopeptide (TPR) repeat protein
MIWIRIFWVTLMSGCLILWAALPARVQAQDRLQLDMTRLFEVHGPKVPTVRIALAESAVCAPNQEPQDLLCDDDHFALDSGRFRAWETRLQPRDPDKSDLCRADTALVQSLRRCEYAGPDDFQMLSGFMNNLAADWRRRGEHERTRELFRGAASLLERVDREDSLRPFVLGNWVEFEFQQGNLGVAASIADRWVDICRYEYLWWPLERSDLIEALRTRAQILDGLGDKAGAHAAAAEAEQLAALPPNDECWTTRTGEVQCEAGQVELITRCKVDVLGETRCYSERKR